MAPRKKSAAHHASRRSLLREFKDVRQANLTVEVQPRHARRLGRCAVGRCSRCRRPHRAARRRRRWRHRCRHHADSGLYRPGQQRRGRRGPRAHRGRQGGQRTAADPRGRGGADRQPGREPARRRGPASPGGPADQGLCQPGGQERQQQGRDFLPDAGARERAARPRDQGHRHLDRRARHRPCGVDRARPQRARAGERRFRRQRRRHPRDWRSERPWHARGVDRRKRRAAQALDQASWHRAVRGPGGGACLRCGRPRQLPRRDRGHQLGGRQPRAAQHPCVEPVVQRAAAVALLGRSAEPGGDGGLEGRHRGGGLGGQLGAPADDHRRAGQRALRDHRGCDDGQLHADQSGR